MINLKIAFSKHPMPLGWELRVAAATGIPYWVSTYMLLIQYFIMSAIMKLLKDFS